MGTHRRKSYETKIDRFQIDISQNRPSGFCRNVVHVKEHIFLYQNAPFSFMYQFCPNLTSTRW